MSTIIKMRCIDQVLTFESTPVIASGGREEDVLQVSFCPMWDGMVKTAVFWRSENNAFHAVLDDQGSCIIPQEVLADEGVLYFGLFGVSVDGRQRTTEVMRYNITKGAITEGTKPSDPTPDLYTQIMATYADILKGLAEVGEVVAEAAGAAEAAKDAAQASQDAAENAQQIAENAQQLAQGAQEAAAAPHATRHAAGGSDPITPAAIGAAAAEHEHDAGDVTGGTFDAARIPSLDASKINSGAFDAARIPSLDASKINSGAFDAARIPSLDASKVTSGTFGADRIPSLDASKVTSGTFGADRIPSLDASKIASGVLPIARGGTGASTAAAALAALGGAKIATTSYVGTGQYGPSNPNTLTFDFEPLAVFIYPSDWYFPGYSFSTGSEGAYGARYGGGKLELLKGSQPKVVYETSESRVLNTALTVTFNGKNVQWYIPSNNLDVKASSGPYAQWSISGRTFIVIAIGK